MQGKPIDKSFTRQLLERYVPFCAALPGPAAACSRRSPREAGARSPAPQAAGPSEAGRQPGPGSPQLQQRGRGRGEAGQRQGLAHQGPS